MSDMSMFRSSTYASEGTQSSLPGQNSVNKPGGIRHAAAEFESILLNQWLTGAETTFGSVPGSDDDEDAGDTQIKSFAVQALAKGITAAGGVGLASMVAKALEAQQTNTKVASPGSAESNGT